MGDPTAFNYITPSEFLEKWPDMKNRKGSSLEDLRKLANAPDRNCDCGMPVWKYGGLGMCFTCTTGESDASDDYELIPE